MAAFQELVKKNNNVIAYTREFFIYGYKSRNHMTINSKRSYDNEKRRLESYLPDYIKGEMGDKGKKIYLDIDPRKIQINPLFTVWETKSFTKYECMLHFTLIELLTEHEDLSLGQIYNKLHETYYPEVEIDDLPDEMTVRNKLNEYVDYGIFTKKKMGKAYGYGLQKNPLASLSHEALNTIVEAIQFYKNTMPFGVLGHQLGKKIMTFDQLKDHEEKPIIQFLHHFIFHTLDDETLLQLLDHVEKGHIVAFDYETKNDGSRRIIEGIPLKVYTNVKHGRRYMVIYDVKVKSYFSLRLDKIMGLKKIHICQDKEHILNDFNKLSKDAWGVFINKEKQTEHIGMKLYIHETKHRFMFRRIEKEGKHGTLKKIGDNLFLYEVDVLDTNEMIPWLRTFIGRIIDIEGSNKAVIKRFKSDMDVMYKLYGIGDETDEKEHV